MRYPASVHNKLIGCWRALNYACNNSCCFHICHFFYVLLGQSSSRRAKEEGEVGLGPDVSREASDYHFEDAQGRGEDSGSDDTWSMVFRSPNFQFSGLASLLLQDFSVFCIRSIRLVFFSFHASVYLYFCIYRPLARECTVKLYSSGFGSYVWATRTYDKKTNYALTRVLILL